MFKNKKVSIVIIGALTLVLAIGLMAFATVDTASAADPVGQEGPDGPRGGRGNQGNRDGQRGPGFGGEDTFLADELGAQSRADRFCRKSFA